MIDFEKVVRQLAHAERQTTSVYRLQLISDLGWVYVHLESKNRKSGQIALRGFDEVAAKEFGWKWETGAALPRPFSHRHLARLYWQARKELFGNIQPRRVYVPQPKVSLNGWRED